MSHINRKNINKLPCETPLTEVQEKQLSKSCIVSSEKADEITPTIAKISPIRSIDLMFEVDGISRLSDSDDELRRKPSD